MAIQDSGNPETHLGGLQLTALSKGLPEWDGPGHSGSVEGEAHETVDKSLEDVGRGPIDQQPRLTLNLETTHGHGVSDKITRDTNVFIRDCDGKSLTGVVQAGLERA